jgi:prefoldin subunit 5
MLYRGLYKMIASTHINAKLQVLNDLLAEINAEGYETIAQVKGSIHSSIESLEILKEKYGE